MEATDQSWPVRLFSRSALKQRKFKEITGLLGKTEQLHCLDIGSDNGVISYLLRRRGGIWKSVDLDGEAVHAIRELVKDNVFQIDGRRTPFHDNEFDRVIIIDFLEHIHTDRDFIGELFRITKPGGELIINVPHMKTTLLRKMRLILGQTDEKHGHVRPGYTIDGLLELLADQFTVLSYKTYSKFLSECIDTLITWALDMLKKGEASSLKGRLVTEHDLRRYRKIFRFYSLIYPIVWLLAKLDTLSFWSSGYMLIVKARITKNPQALPICQQ